MSSVSGKGIQDKENWKNEWMTSERTLLCDPVQQEQRVTDYRVSTDN